MRILSQEFSHGPEQLRFVRAYTDITEGRAVKSAEGIVNEYQVAEEFDLTTPVPWRR